MLRRLRILTAFLLLITGSNSVQADAKNPTYADDMVPLLRQHCMNCHGNDKQKGGLNLATFGAAMQGGASGAVIVPGDPDKSRLFLLTSHKEEPVMPPTGNKIPDAQIELMRLWIEQGARENSGSKAMTPKPKVNIGLTIVSKGKPEGPPPMPQIGALALDPIVHARRANSIIAIAASPWAPLLAVGGQHQVLLYNTDNGALLGMLPYEHGQINSLKFSRNSKMLLVAGGHGGLSGKAVLYDVETGKKITEVGSEETDAIMAADLSPDQTLIAIGSPTKMIRVYSTADGSVVSSIKKHTDWVCAVEFSPDGVLLATGDRNGGLFVWEAATGREFHTLRGHTGMITDISWRGDSNVFASGSEDGSIRLWEVENGGNIKTWTAHGGGTSSVQYSHDGRLASTGRDKVTKVWDGNGGLQKQFEAFADIGLQVAISNDDARVIAGDWTGALKMWTIADAKIVAVLDTNPAPIADRIKTAQALVAAAEAKVKPAADAYAATQVAAKTAADAYTAAQANATKISADLAAAQKAVTDHTAAAKVAADQVAPTKAEVDKATGVLTAATNKAASLDVTAPAYAAAAKAIADAAAKAPQNADLAAASKAATATATQQTTEQAAAKKAATDAAAALKVVSDKYAALTKAVTDHQAAAAEAQKKVATLTPMVKPAQDAIAPAKANADKVAASVAPAKAAVDATVAEVATAKKQLETLTAAVKPPAPAPATPAPATPAPATPAPATPAPATPAPKK